MVILLTSLSLYIDSDSGPCVTVTVVCQVVSPDDGAVLPPLQHVCNEEHCKRVSCVCGDPVQPLSVVTTYNRASRPALYTLCRAVCGHCETVSLSLKSDSQKSQFMVHRSSSQSVVYIAQPGPTAVIWAGWPVALPVIVLVHNGAIYVF